MGSFTKSARCLNCSKDNTFSLSTELALTELQIQAKCGGCSNSVQITFALVDSTPKTEVSPVGLDSTVANADEDGELPSKAIEDLIG